RRHTRFSRDWSSDVCSSDLGRSDSIWQAGYSDLITNADGSQLAFLRPHVLSLIDSKTLQTTQVIDDWYGMKQLAYHPNEQQLIRSEERRVGKESRSTVWP